MNQTKLSHAIKPTDKPIGKVVRFGMAQWIFELSPFCRHNTFFTIIQNIR